MKILTYLKNSLLKIFWIFVQPFLKAIYFSSMIFNLLFYKVRQAPQAMDVQLTVQTQIQPQVKRININLSLCLQFMTIREWEVPDSQGNQEKKQTVSTFTAGNAQQAQRAQRATKLLKQCHCHRMTTFSLVSLFSCLFTSQHKSL